MTGFDEAIDLIIDSVLELDGEKVSIEDAFGRVLREDVIADSDIPFQSNSAMDGYAIIAADVEQAGENSPVALEVIETIPAGSVPKKKVTTGHAARIFTGAPMPKGADAVMMQEFTNQEGTVVSIMAPSEAGKHTRPAGEDLKKGETVLEKGRVLRAADIGIAASAGKPELLVGRKPTVAILSTGGEIIEPTEPAGPGRVRNSNSRALYAKCTAAGALPRYYGITPDNESAIEKSLKKAASECDMILTSGGVSVGDYDLVGNAVQRLGKLDFWKINMKPGRPLAFGAVGDAVFFGLPGNPVAALIGFELFVRPAILKMAGASQLKRTRLPATMEHSHKEKPARTKILRGVATYGRNGITARTTGAQGSGVLSSVVLANCFIIIPDGTGAVGKGTEVEIIPLDKRC